MTDGRDSELYTEAEEAYSPEYLSALADGDARRERLEELRRRIECKAYRVQSDRIAEELLERGLLGG
ncbi:MAG: flagellar biosynthesis anti-sigma factor FlgM [Myxococcota bacterium]